jgi:RNA polymerase sigma-70 factor (TIGR02960 family)
VNRRSGEAAVLPSNAEFAAMTGPFRPELLAHCYRLLGSIHDAEDLVQETYLRAWRGFDRFEGRSSLRRWLYKIATMACLTALESRARRPLPSGLGPPSDDAGAAVAPLERAVAWLQPVPDALLDTDDPSAIVVRRSAVRLAFVAALQVLPARQRAVLTLRDVLAFRTAEVAEMLDTTTAAVDSALRRARAHLHQVGPVQDDLAEPDEEARQALLERYVDAFTRADAGALVDLLRADVEMEMPPIPTWFTGRQAVVGFLTGHVLRHRDQWHLEPTRANGQPAFVVRRRTGEAYGIQVLTLIGLRIARITAFNDPGLVPTFAARRSPSHAEAAEEADRAAHRDEDRAVGERETREAPEQRGRDHGQGHHHAGRPGQAPPGAREPERHDRREEQRERPFDGLERPEQVGRLLGTAGSAGIGGIADARRDGRRVRQQGVRIAGQPVAETADGHQQRPENGEHDPPDGPPVPR